jgi:thiamine pyrophosphokinase
MSSEDPRAVLAAAIFPRRDPRAVLLCDGMPPPRETLGFWLADADLFVCTDAAGRPYDKLPRRPDLVVGDFDTLRGGAMPGTAEPRYIRAEDQERSDSEKALGQIASEGMGEAVLLGTRGGRLDHSLHNLSLLEAFADRLRLCLADEWGLNVRLGPESEAHFDLPVGTLFSLLAPGGPATGVEVGGAEFPLAGAELRFGGNAALSNRVVASPLRIRLAGGSLILSVALAEHSPGTEEPPP